MAKISPVTSKYIIHATIEIEGVVDKPDVIGAIFGQTEGLLGADLELRELQRSGRIGRIEVNVDTSSGKTKGEIVIPSSMDKAETAIIGAAMEIIQRIGPCNAKIKVGNIEDVRISKRKFVVERAKELLKNMMDGVMPDSQEIADEVAYSVRVMEIQEYGKDRCPAGPGIDENEEAIVVEGRADVITMLKHGFKNVIAINGSNVPQTIIDLSKQKSMIVFVDGDRGGDLNVKELLQVAEIDFVTKAPDGKEVEELTKKEIHKALRAKIAAEQVKLDFETKSGSDNESRKRPSQYQERRPPFQQRDTRGRAPPPAGRRGPPSAARAPAPSRAPSKVSPESKSKFKSMLEDLIGTKGAFLLDEKLNLLGKVPGSELTSTVKSLSTGIHAIIFDGTVEKELVEVAEKANVKIVVGMDSKVDPKSARINIFTAETL
ncbi:DNA primase DnaG [Nanoarchaeota archaeon]